MRYQVVTWSWDIGSDERRDFPHLTDAIKEAKKYKKTEEYAAIYDSKERIAFVVFGNIETPVFNNSVRVISIE